MPKNSFRLAKNNFDLLRLLFAGTVLLIHAYQLSGMSELEIFTKFLSSEVAVKAFFVVSGFLIFMSYERSNSLALYAKKRIRRIYPAYILVIIFCATGLFAASTKTAPNYFSSEWARYILSNLAFLNFLQPTRLCCTNLIEDGLSPAPGAVMP